MNMPIYADSTELRNTSRLPPGFPCKPCSCLERETGADFLVTAHRAPPAVSPATIAWHVGKGAVLVQRKSLRDMVESCLYGINASVARMQAVTEPWQWRQRCFLASGVFLPYMDNDAGKLKVRVGVPSFSDATNTIRWHWQRTNVDYKAFTTAKRRLPLLKGCWLEIVSCDDEIPVWLQDMERDLMKYKPVKEVYPKPHKFPPPGAGPLQEVREVADCRTVLAALKGIGPVRAGQLYDGVRAYNEVNLPLDRGWTKEDWEPTLGQLWTWAMMEDPDYYSVAQYHPWSKAQRDKVRAQVPLCPGQDFQIRETCIPIKKRKGEQ